MEGAADSLRPRRKLAIGVGLAASFDAVANLWDGRFPGSYVESATVGVSASSWLRSRSHR